MKTYAFDFGKKTVPVEVKNSYEELSQKRAVNDYIYFFEAPFIVGNTFVGSVYKGKNKGTLVYNLKSDSYIINEWVPNKLDYKDIILPLFTDGKQIVGWLDDEIYQSLKIKPLLCQDNIRHLKEGGHLLVFYNLTNDL